MEMEDKNNREIIPIINSSDVEALMSAIIKRQIMVDRFRFNLSAQKAFDLLTACYRITVESRQRTFREDDNVVNVLMRFASFITAENPKFGVMLCGTCGNGKSTMLYAFQKALNFLKRGGHFSFLSKEFEVGMEIVDAMEITILSKDYNKMRSLRSRSMLAIDDLGKEPAEVLSYGNVLSPVVDLLEYRYQHQLFTAITTNLTAAELQEKYGVRIADRFNEMLEVIVFQDVRYRC